MDNDALLALLAGRLFDKLPVVVAPAAGPKEREAACKLAAGQLGAMPTRTYLCELRPGTGGPGPGPGGRLVGPAHYSITATDARLYLLPRGQVGRYVHPAGSSAVRLAADKARMVTLPPGCVLPLQAQLAFAKMFPEEGNGLVLPSHLLWVEPGHWEGKAVAYRTEGSLHWFEAAADDVASGENPVEARINFDWHFEDAHYWSLAVCPHCSDKSTSDCCRKGAGRCRDGCCCVVGCCGCRNTE
jgi:hypothetical protein